jgi:hypothetical protein
MSTTLRRALAAFATAFLVAGSALVVVPAASAASPGLIVTSPASGSVFKSGTIYFSGSVPEGATDLVVGLDRSPNLSIPSAISGSTFSFSWSGLAEGQHTVTLLSGGQTASVSLTIDGTAPAIAFTSPVEGFAAEKDDEVTISFTASGLGGGSLYLMPSGDGEHLIASGVDTVKDIIVWTFLGSPGIFEHRVG